MIKKGLLIIMTLGIFAGANAQTVEEMQAEKAAKEAQLAELNPELKELTDKVTALKADVKALKDKLTPYPRWNTGSFGTLGFNFANFDQWLQKDQPSTQAANIGFTLNGFANLDQKKYFWRNNAGLNLSWLKFDNKDVDDDVEGFQVASDAFNITSLFGYKLNKNLAISALGEYRTAMLDGRFNNPGYLDLGVGGTWTPTQNMVVVFHPLNYNFVFADEGFDYMSSLGCKIVADYTQQFKSISWKSNFSTFISYEDASNLSNWTWVNTFSTAYKGIGIGLDIGLRNNKQEAFNVYNTNNPDNTFENVGAFDEDNPLQTYWILGLSYALGSK
jgi:hypothetical protein